MLIIQIGLMKNFVKQGDLDKLKHTKHKTNTCSQSTGSVESYLDTTIAVDTSKHKCGYGRFSFTATKRQAKILGAIMYVFYLGLTVVSVFFWSWMIEKFIIWV